MMPNARYFGRKSFLPLVKRAARKVLAPLLSVMPAVKKKSMTPGFAQRVFTLILQRLENGDGTELMDLRDRLTDDEMGRLSGIIARGGESADAKQEFSDCLQIIRAEQQKKQESAAELDDQAFRDLFRHHS